MIVKVHLHGRTPSARAGLAAHLASAEAGQSVHLVRVRGTTAGTIEGAIESFARLRPLSARARVCFLHISLNPRRPWDAARRDEAVARVLRALSAERHAHALIAHADKPRARGLSAATHFHLLIANVGPHGRALPTSFLHARLEAVRAALEVDFGEALTPSRRTDAVARRLRWAGRADVAAAVEAIEPAPGALPRSGLTAATRGRLARAGLSAPALRARVMDAYARSDGRAALAAALTKAGMTLAAGERTGVWIVRAGGHLVGALDRLVARPRAEVGAFLRPPIPRVRQPIPWVPRRVVRPYLPAPLTIRRPPSAPPGPPTAQAVVPPAPAASRAIEQGLEGGETRDTPAYWTAQIVGLLEVEEAALARARMRPPPPDRGRLLALAERRVGAARVAVSTAEASLEELRRSPSLGLLTRLLGRTAAHRSAEALAAAAARTAADALWRAKSRRARVQARVGVERDRWRAAVAHLGQERLAETRTLEGRVALWRETLAVIAMDPGVTAGGSAAIKAAVAARRARLATGPGPTWDGQPAPPADDMETERYQPSVRIT